MKGNKLKLFNDCIPVKGASRGTICDIQRNELKFVPNSLCDMLIKHDGKSLDELIEIYGAENKETIQEYIDFLIENDFAFWCKNPEFFPPLNLEWNTPSIITNGIIDVDKNSSFDFKNIFEQYNELGCEYIQIRFFNKVDLLSIQKKLRYTALSRIRSIELLIPFSNKNKSKDYNALINSCPRINRIIVHSSPKTDQILTYPVDSLADVILIPDKINSHLHCGVISPGFFEVNREMYRESIHHNSCLNRKISIDINGNIKNCPSLSKSYGNINSTTLKEALLNEGFKSYWSVNKDQIDTCKDCEFRYVCTDCRAFLDSPYSKPKKCNYNPYSMKWEN